MNCRFCGAAIPQGIAYCPACKQPVFQGPGNAQGPSFPPPSTGLLGGYRANQQTPAPYERPASPGPSVSSLPSPQMPDNTYAPQTSMTGGPRLHTENLSPMPFAQPGNQISPVTNDQSWPAPFTQAPGQPFPNGFSPAQPYNAGAGTPQTQPFANQLAFPTPGLSSSPSSAGFPGPAIPPTTPERNSGPWAAPANFGNNTARSNQAEASSRFLYGPSASSSFPFNAGGPSASNAGANVSTPATPSTPGQGFPFANPSNTPEPVRTNPSGRLASAIIAPTRKRRNPIGMIGIITLLVVLAIGGIAAVVEFTNGGFNTASNNSIVVQTTIPLAGATPVVGPSGQKVTTAASSIIINAQTASALNSSYIPTQATTSFATNQTIYASLVINSNNQNGYILIKWYENNRLLSTDNLAHNAKDNIAFFTQKYTSPSNGSAELYWCTKADCSDAQLARVVHFTVHQ
jgi:hypothetical protein